jgi:8-oxo-dGTP pyrophosphatase MutT (NUDIX family)
MQKYVAGLAFDARGRVLLVRKHKPAWQSGLLNAVGGKIEIDETPALSMEREFHEEAGVLIPGATWHLFCVEFHSKYEVYFFKVLLSSDESARVQAQNDVGEPLSWFETSDVLRGNGLNCRCVGNLLWLVPMAQDWRRLSGRVWTQGDIVDAPTWPSGA